MWCVSRFKENKCKINTIICENRLFDRYIDKSIKIVVHMCTFVYYSSTLCPSGGLVSLDLRGWRRLTHHHHHLAQQCPFKGVHLQQGRCSSASRLHSATLFDKRPRLNGGRTPHHQHHQHHPNTLCCLLTDSHTEQMSNHGFWHSHFIPCIIVGPVGSAVHGRPHLRKPPPPLFILQLMTLLAGVWHLPSLSSLFSVWNTTERSPCTPAYLENWR